jgi:hypothetical protein
MKQEAGSKREMREKKNREEGWQKHWERVASPVNSEHLLQIIAHNSTLLPKRCAAKYITTTKYQYVF